MRIAINRLPLIVDRFALARRSFEVLAQLCIALARIDLRHTEGTVTEQSTDDLKRNIIVHEAHTHRVPKLVSGKVVEFPRAVFDLVLHSPCIECIGKCRLLVWAQMGSRTGEEIRTGLSPL